MKRWILPACLIAAGLIAAAFGCFHARSTISRSNAEQIATSYIIKNSSYYEKEKYQIKIANLGLDIVSIVTGKQKWTVFTVFPQCCLSINAYTGNVERVYDGFYEWVPQNGNSLPIGDYVFLAFYFLMTLLSFFYWKSRVLRPFFWISAACLGVLILSFCSVVFYG